MLVGGDVSLVRTLDGQCGNWCQFLVATLAAQGLTKSITTSIQVVRSADDKEARIGGFLVGAWSFEGTAAAGMYPYRNKMGRPTGSFSALPAAKFSNTWFYVWSDGDPQVKYQGRPPGQSNPNPPAAFNVHQLVKFGDQYYDPSYGVRYPDAQAFLDGAVTGFYLVLPDGAGRVFAARPKARGATAAASLVFTTLVEYRPK